MGGRIAEETSFDQITTGAQNDIEQATEMARKMVCEWGMSEALGPLTYGKKEEAIFLGKEFNRHQDYSEATALKIDAEVKRIVIGAVRRGRSCILTEQPPDLVRVAEALLEHEVLDAPQLKQLIAGEPLTVKPAPPPPVAPPQPPRAARRGRAAGRAHAAADAASEAHVLATTEDAIETRGRRLYRIPLRGAERGPRRAHARDGRPQRHPRLLLGRRSARGRRRGRGARAGALRGGRRLGGRRRRVDAARARAGRAPRRRSRRVVPVVEGAAPARSRAALGRHHARPRSPAPRSTPAPTW